MPLLPSMTDIHNQWKNQIYLFLRIGSEELIDLQGIRNIFYHPNYHIRSKSINFSLPIVPY